MQEALPYTNYKQQTLQKRPRSRQLQERSKQMKENYKRANVGPMFDTMEQAIAASQMAQQRFRPLSFQKRREIIDAIRTAARNNAEELAKEAVKETGMGRWEDKLKKKSLLVEKVKNMFMQAMRDDRRAYELTCDQMDELAKICINGSEKDSDDPNKEVVLNREYVGKNPSFIAKAVGLNLPDSTRLLWGVVDNNHPLVWNEQLMPFFPVTFVKTVEEAINFAVKVEKGNNHTFIMHSSNTENLTKMASAAPSAIFVKNGPSYMAIGMGEGYAALSIATATGDGLVRARTFTRPMVSIDYFKAA